MDTSLRRAYILIAVAVVLVSIVYAIGRTPYSNLKPALATSSVGTTIEHPGKTPFEHTGPKAPSSFVYTFNVDGILEETGSIAISPSPYWHVDSGGRMLIEDGVGKTIQGEAKEGDRWRSAYNAANPLDTDSGRYPQNIFRLVSKETWSNSLLEVSFLIRRDNMTDSPARNESNGILFMSRYKEGGDTLYYAGLRVDGNAVIKKKYEGVYYTMALRQIYAGTYSRTLVPNLLPRGEWIRLRMESTTLNNGVRIRLYIQNGERWDLLVEAIDSGGYSGTPPIIARDHVGIRTDYMDVEFKDFKALPI